MNMATAISPDLWGAIRRSYEAEAWSNAILDAIYFFSDVVRTKSGLQSDGVALAGQAFGGKDPKLKLNRLATDTEINVQAGVEQITRGLYQAIRNPRSHERISDSQEDADAIIIFVNYLLRVIGHAKSVFSVEGLLARINDDNFVSNARYAELILSEIPKNKRLDAAIAAFEARDTRDCRKYKALFQSMISSLDEQSKGQFFDAITNHLRDSIKDAELRSVFQLLEPDQWHLIGEAERMRSENRVVRSISEGKYSTRAGRCLSGALATWADEYFPKFTLKKEVLAELTNALLSDVRERQDYVLRNFFLYLDDLAKDPPARLIRHINVQLGRGDARYKVALDTISFIGGPWMEPFKVALEKFEARDDVAPQEQELDDLPF